MTNKELTRKLKAAWVMAKKHRRLLDEIADFCEDIYGYSYNDADSDFIIDTIEYGIGEKPITARDLHKMMKEKID